MKINNERTEQLLNECIDYLTELKDNDCKEDWDLFWKNIIGMTDEEMQYYSLEKEEDEEGYIIKEL